MITHSMYASLIPISIAIAIVFALFVVAKIYEQQIIRFEDRMWMQIKRGIRRTMLKSRRIREWALRESLPAEYRVDDFVYWPQRFNEVKNKHR